MNFFYNIQITKEKIKTNICKKCNPGKIADPLTNSCTLCYEKCKTCIGKSSGLCTSCKLNHRFLQFGNNEKGNFGFCIENNNNIDNIQLKKSNFPLMINNEEIFLKLNENEKYYSGYIYDDYYLNRNPFKNNINYIANQLKLIYIIFSTIKMNI